MDSKVDGVVFCSLLDEDNLVQIVSPFILELDWDMVRCDGNKSLGPSGLNFFFFRRFWILLIEDLGIMFDQFQCFVPLPCRFASSFVILISKVKYTSRLVNFTLIYIVGYLYKLVTKVLKNRLGLVIDKLTSSNQTTFLKGMLLVNEVVKVNKVIYLNKRSRRIYLIFKVDFKKVYDSISWIFLHYMLIRFRFNDKWRS